MNKGPIIIVQARLSSRRLPGKVLLPVRSKPLLQYVFESLAQISPPTKVYLATSLDPSDDAVAAMGAKFGIEVFRGSLESVSERYRALLVASGAPAFVRICGDSPLLDYRVVEKALAEYAEGKAELVTNLHPRTFPKGQSVEVVDSATFLRACESFHSVDDKEHVTSYFYAHASEFTIRNFESGGSFNAINQSVDSADDLRRFANLVEKMESPHWAYDWKALLKLEGNCQS